MDILVADDDPVARGALAAALEMSGFSVREASDGLQALAVLQGRGAPRIAILDWMMPGLDGVQVCERVRAMEALLQPYLIVLTSRDSRDDVLQALNRGADEFLSKPIEPPELSARVGVGRRMVALQDALAEHVERLQAALDDVKTLQGILPICAYCKKIRNDKNYWQQLEHYISTRTDATFSHGICPDCFEKHVRPEMESLGVRPPEIPS